MSENVSLSEIVFATSSKRTGLNSNTDNVGTRTGTHYRKRIRGGATVSWEPEQTESNVNMRDAPLRKLWLLFATENGEHVSKRALFKSIKICLLLIVWLIMVVLMACKKKHSEDNVLLTVSPGAARDFRIPAEHVDKQIGVICNGPFQDSEKAPSGKKPNWLQLQVTRAKQVALSDAWHVYLESHDLERMREYEKQHAFVIWQNGSQNASDAMYLTLTSNVAKQFTVKLRLDRYPVERQKGLILGAIVLILLYAMVVSEVINRTIASIFCATLALSVLVMLNNRIEVKTVMEWVDVETLLLLFGMMILVALFSDSGVFDYFAVRAYEISRGHIWPLINSLCFFTAILSAFLDNVTMMLLIAPIIIKLCEALSLNPVTVITCMVLYSNVGAASTPIGDPPNIIITMNEFISEHGVNFGNFMLHTVPCVALVLMQTYWQLHFMLRKSGLQPLTSEEIEVDRKRRESKHMSSLKTPLGPIVDKPTELYKIKVTEKIGKPKLPQKPTPTNSAPGYEEMLAKLQSQYGIKNKPLLIKSSIAFIFVLSLFFMHSFHGLHHLSLGWAALVGAIMLLVLVDIRDFPAILARVEWATLVFFASLFILMEVMSKLGLIELIGDCVVDLILTVDKQYRMLMAIVIILWVSAMASAFLDNIPVTAMMVRIIITLARDNELQLSLQPLVWALAMGACFGGNGTLIAASANVVSAGVAQQHGYTMGFIEFFVIGFPVMIGNVIVTTLYLICAHVLFEWHDPPLDD